MSGRKSKLLSGPQLVIFTDLDGTLLDSRYSFQKALPALTMIQEKSIPLVISSSKTRSEIEHCRKKLKNRDPFISENGGGIYIPGDSGMPMKRERISEEAEGYKIIRLGAPYGKLRRALAELRDEGFAVRGFGDMTAREVSQLTGLKPADARRAKQRDFDEPFIFDGDTRAVSRLKCRITLKGFNYTQGEFFHIMGDSDKGRAVGILKELYAGRYRNIVTAALGDSPNDIEMLRSVDYPVVVRKKNGEYDRRIRVRNLIRADGIGPEGWNRAVIKLLESMT